MPRIVDTPRRITCVACGLVAEGATDRLCVGCAEHPRGTRRHVGEQVDQYWQQERQAWDMLRQAVEGADEETAARWYNYQDAYAQQAPGALQAELAVRKGLQGPLATLIRLYLNWVDAFTAVSERRQWAARVEGALSELATPRAPRKAEFVLTLGQTRRQTPCRSCGAPMCYITTISGAQLPISVASLVERDGQWYGLSHFSDCPQGKGWSKR